MKQSIIYILLLSKIFCPKIFCSDEQNPKKPVLNNYITSSDGKYRIQDNSTSNITQDGLDSIIASNSLEDIKSNKFENIKFITLSKNSNIVAGITNNDELFISDLGKIGSKPDILSKDLKFEAISINPNGSHLIAATKSKIYLWDLQKRTYKEMDNVHTASIDFISINSKYHNFAISHSDIAKELIIWDFNTATHSLLKRVSVANFSPNGEMLIFNKKNMLYFHKINKDSITPITGCDLESPANSIAFSGDSLKAIVTGLIIDPIFFDFTNPKTFEAYDLEPDSKLVSENNFIITSNLNHDGSIAVFGAIDGTVLFHDTITDKLINKYNCCSMIKYIELSPDKNYAAITCIDRVILLNIETLENIEQLYTCPIKNKSTFSADQKKMITSITTKNNDKETHLSLVIDLSAYNVLDNISNEIKSNIETITTQLDFTKWYKLYLSLSKILSKNLMNKINNKQVKLIVSNYLIEELTKIVLRYAGNDIVDYKNTLINIQNQPSCCIIL